MIRILCLIYRTLRSPAFKNRWFLLNWSDFRIIPLSKESQLSWKVQIDTAKMNNSRLHCQFLFRLKSSRGRVSYQKSSKAHPKTIGLNYLRGKIIEISKLMLVRRCLLIQVSWLIHLKWTKRSQLLRINLIRKVRIAMTKLPQCLLNMIICQNFHQFANQ